MHPQQPMRNPVKRTDPQRTSRHPQQRFGAAAHFGGRLVGERDREYAVRRDTFRFDQPRNAMHQHARFTAAGAGDDQQIADRRGDGLALPIIEPIEDVRDVQRKPKSDSASDSFGRAGWLYTSRERRSARSPAIDFVYSTVTDFARL